MSRRAMVWSAVAMLVFLPFGLLALLRPGFPGDGMGSMSGMNHATASPRPARLVRLTPDEFAERMERPEAVVVNVHVPYEGEIEGTDVFAPFDRIVEEQVLPADRDAEIMLYCRSGTMSEVAATSLLAAGYRNVVDLRGGMRQWEREGRPIARRAG